MAEEMRVGFLVETRGVVDDGEGLVEASSATESHPPGCWIFPKLLDCIGKFREDVGLFFFFGATIDGIWR